jgi:predicted O-methyltransferase YrrM
MTQQTWTAVDEYLASLFVGPDAALDAALSDAAAAGLPNIHVSPMQGKLLHLLARLMRAERILEIGTLAGYSTVWLARALPPAGRLTTLERDAHHAEVARKNLARAGVADKVDLRLAPAIETLPRLAAEGQVYDLIFIDADKPSTPDYFTWSLKLSRPGTLILIDNVVRKGAVTDPASTDANVQGIRKLNTLLAAEKRVTVTTLQTVGLKGYDGLTLALVTG